MAARVMPSPFKFGYYYDEKKEKADIKEPQLYDGERHILLFGVNGAGKSTRILIENLVTIKNRSLVIFDMKGELAAQTIRTRRTLGDVKLVNPYNVLDLGSDGYNPLAALDPDDDLFYDKAKLVTVAIIEVEGDSNKFFPQTAQGWFCGGIMWEVVRARREDRPPSLLKVREWCLQPDQWELSPDGKTQTLIAGVSLNAQKMVAQGGPEIAGLASRFAREELNRSDQDVLTTLATQTEFLVSRPISRDLEKGKWSFAQLREKPTSVYIVLPPDQVNDKRRWTRMLITAALCDHMQPGQVKTLFILDEFRVSIGHLEIVNNFWSLVRGYGVQFMPVCQSVLQLRALFKDEWENYAGQAGVVVTIGPPGDTVTAEWMSKRSGNRTIWQEGWSEGEGLSGQGSTSNLGETRAQVKQAFISPEAMMSMKLGTGRIWPSGHGDISIPFFAPNFWQRRELRGLIDPNPYFEGGAAAVGKAQPAAAPASPNFWTSLYSLELPLKTKLFILMLHILPKRVLFFINRRDPEFLAKINKATAAATAAVPREPPKPPPLWQKNLYRLGGWLLLGIVAVGLYHNPSLMNRARPWVAEHVPSLLAYIPAGSGTSSTALTEFDAGKTDWNNWFTWVHGKSGELRAGIDFWAEVRNDKERRPSSCRSAMHGDISAEFYEGCAAAKKFLSVVDQYRLSEPDYRQGWNAGYKTTGNP